MLTRSTKMNFMTKKELKNNWISSFFSLLFGLSLLWSLVTFANKSFADETDLASAPLVNATPGEVLPNLMYVLDNSGSMDWNFMPDYVGYNGTGNYKTKYENKCKASNGVFSSSCYYGDPPFNSPAFNSVYYNPDVTYLPPKNAAGDDMTSMTSANTAGWTSVPRDGFGIQSSANDTLVPTYSGLYPNDGYKDVAWCNTGSPSTADKYDLAVCRVNSKYIYPTSTYNRATTIYGYPFYYKIGVGEYCNDKNLTVCVTSAVPTGSYTYPAKLRWCKDSARTNCQAKYIEDTGYTYAKWTAIVNSSVGGTIQLEPEDSGCGGSGKPSCTAPSAMSITSLTIGGVSIIPASPSPALTITDTTSLSARTSLASAIATAINTKVSTPDFTATAVGDLVTITPVGAATNATIVMTSSSVSGAPIVGTQKASGSFQITNSRSGAQVNNIKVGGTDILNQTIYTSGGSNNSASRQTMANDLVNRINSFVSSPDYTAVSDNASYPTVTITAVNKLATSNGALQISRGGRNSRLTISSIIDVTGGNGGSAKTYTIPFTIGQYAGTTPVATTFSRVDIVPTKLTYSRASSRTDCDTSACTYDQEMTNFANWYAYYQTRMQMMKTSTSRAFESIDNRFRVGFITIANQSSNYLPVSDYDNAQKVSWYKKLFDTDPRTSTPLRSALTTVGRIYAGKNPLGKSGGDDPMQYSCQQNFTILTTDGYWNSDSNSDVKQINGTSSIGNMDGGTGANQTPRPMYEGPTASSATLADAAKYYYDTDLRTPSLGNCTGNTRYDGSTGDVCNNNVYVTPTDNNNQQHMTTFTLGLGVDATLTYDPDYKTATSGDFYDLSQSGSSVNWPVPVADSQTAVDDLWHAAVNGQGTYFSAKDPNQLATSLTSALNSIKSKVGAGAAAATSSLNPVQGDNFNYVASYTTVTWKGNLEKRTINTTTGVVSQDAVWCLEDIQEDTCANGSSKVYKAGNASNGYTSTYQCVTPSVTSASNCSGVYDATAKTCSVEIKSACVGTMADLVSSNISTNDTRNIYMNVNGALGSFTSSNLSAAGKNTHFTNTFLASKLSQWSSLTDGTGGTYNQRGAVGPNSLVNYLRGNTVYEDRAVNASASVDNRLYRLREAVLGDLIDSTPIYLAGPKAKFSDPGHSAFKSAQASRVATVFIGANDGMLHAIDAVTGIERWAYVPSMVLDNMWQLADKDYGNNTSLEHAYFVDGDIVVNDVCASNCTSAANAVWKTILVAGLNNGGQGYFALDVTNPNSPSLLWEFSWAPDYAGDASYDEDMGYSYGNPIITKKADGTWVVVFASGYNNTFGAQAGKGFLYVVDAITGNKIAKYGTGVGDDGTNCAGFGCTPDGPSGLAKINAYVVDGEQNNTAVNIYGGDLLGNLWKFDINASTGASPALLAVLKDPSGVRQPITVRPEISIVNSKPILYVGTGRYLGKSDVDFTATPQVQSIYAISDSITSPPLDPRGGLLVKQTLVNDTVTATRTMGQPIATVDYQNDKGWYIDLPDSGERQNVPAQLAFGIIILPTIVPSNTICSPGGYGWVNYLDYKSGALSSGVVASKTNAPVVGVNLIYINGKPVVNVVTADDPTPKPPSVGFPKVPGGISGFTNRRAILRELIQ
jgi:type IV pilus assembly protein PilY1